MITIALGTTPTILINLDKVDPKTFVIADLTIKGRNNILLTRNIDTAIIKDSQISWKLTQKETLALGLGTYSVMCNWVTADETRGITKEDTLQVIDNHERWELYPSDVEPDDDDPTETIIQTDPLNLDAYATPQMYGARADGYTDDTEAIQQAIDSGKAVYLSAGEYRITAPLVITDKRYWSFNGDDAIITYSGTGYAVRILNASHCHISIGMINALSGGGVEFYSDSRQSWNQYVTLSFGAIRCATDCIHAETAGEGWCNENRIHGGQFMAGQNGLHIVSTGAETTNGWKVYDCGIEGVTTGIYLESTNGENSAICNSAFINCRYGESFEKILKTEGIVYDCKWSAPTAVIPSFFDCSEQTTRIEVDAPISYYWRLPSRAWHRGCIIGGVLKGEATSYEEVTV